MLRRSIEIVGVKSHAEATFDSMELYDPSLAITEKPHDRIFRRDCLEIDLKIGGRPLTIYAVHLKSMQSPRDADGRLATMPLRTAETRAVRKIIEQRFGAGGGDANFLICGDMNDYQERLVISGSPRLGYQFAQAAEAQSALDIFSADGFAENLVRRRAPDDRWTLYHAQGLQVRHLSQLDYIWASPALARANPDAVPDIIRKGQPFRTPFPPGQEVERFPRTGWDRPKASDHCPVVVELSIP